ncbi:MAG: V-type ATP synthase subunit A [Chitinophagaceae bacterium]|nr:V-type ATP synthase subunit A [Chitinophagaceae bacterium]
MRTGKVKAIVSNLVIVTADGAVAQNEICHILLGEIFLKAEVIKTAGDDAYVQVFESTRGLKVGDEVIFQGHLLEVSLGPGILTKKYDGLQNDLDKIESIFLSRGTYTDALDMNSEWDFIPLVKNGDMVVAASWLGEVKEKNIPHKIMAPFILDGEFSVKKIADAGRYKLTDTIATLEDKQGNETAITMVQKWPVIKTLKGYKEKIRPYKLLETGIRIIDMMNPMAEGGTGFIPGPFGSGKTVLQHAIARQAKVDVVVVVACGERANEIVEIFTEFPQLDDPQTGGKLIDRTVIIANTSNMPVASRQASVYTGMTIAEYYRAMGLKVLVLADSTSRWAQALREISNRMEELPGPDAYPMDLPAVVSGFYARAGQVKLVNGKDGSITFIGTVSPAGGNLKEPVTEATKKAAHSFYALSQRRADSKRYPAIDAIESYSKFLDYPELVSYMHQTIAQNWKTEVVKMKDRLFKGHEAMEQISILGDDNVPVDYHETFWKSELIDFVILQQDAFDSVDGFTSLERLKYMQQKISEICEASFHFSAYEEVGVYFRSIINAWKQINYSAFQSEEFKNFNRQLDEIVNERKQTNGNVTV